MASSPRKRTSSKARTSPSRCRPSSRRRAGSRSRKCRLGFTPYRHQRIAHQRLDFGAAHGGRSTIVATGTGSGKTECFLWPIPDHCRRHAGEEGVKAILVYPMNALAFDRVWRLAEVIHDAPGLRGKVSAGLYVGEREKTPHTTMGREHPVTVGRRCANARRTSCSPTTRYWTS